MIYGIGTDILQYGRVEKHYAAAHPAVLHKIFTEKELMDSHKVSEPQRFLTGRFCAKEAVFKTLHTAEDIKMSDIEILSGDNIPPEVLLSGSAKRIADAARIKTLHLSLSYETDYVVAFAIAETD